MLLEKGAAVDPQDSSGKTPLSWATENEHEAVIKLLLEKGAGISKQMQSVSLEPPVNASTAAKYVA